MGYNNTNYEEIVGQYIQQLKVECFIYIGATADESDGAV